MKAMAVLPEADDLARFANLETDKDAASFLRKTTGRDEIPDFAPPAWWIYRSTDSSGEPLGEKQWRFVQSLVQEAWDQQFQSDVGLFDVVRLLLSVFNPKGLLENVIPISSNTYRPLYADVSALAEEYGFHKAIRYLAGGPSWRIKICEKCDQRFVADHNERKYCSERCSYERERESRNDWGRENNWGRPVKPKKKKRKSSPRLPVYRPKS